MQNKSFLIDEEKLSRWAYLYCIFVGNDPKIKENITDSYWAYNYCKDISNDPEVRKNITDSIWAYKYCIFVNNDPEVRKYIKHPKFLEDLKNE